MLDSFDLKTVNENGQTILHLAALHGLEEFTQLLLDKKVDINAKDPSGCTALSYVKRPIKKLLRSAKQRNPRPREFFFGK